MPRLSITLTDSQAAALDRIAAETGATKQSMIGLAISAWVAEQERRAMRDSLERERRERQEAERERLADEEDERQRTMANAEHWASWVRTWDEHGASRDHGWQVHDRYDAAVKRASALAAKLTNDGVATAEPMWEPCDAQGVPLLL